MGKRYLRVHVAEDGEIVMVIGANKHDIKTVPLSLKYFDILREILLC